MEEIDSSEFRSLDEIVTDFINAVECLATRFCVSFITQDIFLPHVKFCLVGVRTSAAAKINNPRLIVLQRVALLDSSLVAEYNQSSLQWAETESQ